MAIKRCASDAGSVASCVLPLARPLLTDGFIVLAPRCASRRISTKDSEGCLTILMMASSCAMLLVRPASLDRLEFQDRSGTLLCCRTVGNSSHQGCLMMDAQDVVEGPCQ